VATSHYEKVLREVCSACRRGHNKLKFVNPKGGKGVSAVLVCDNEFHTVFITPSGGVSFHNHKVKELHNLVTMDKLAHEMLNKSTLAGCGLLLRGLKDVPAGQSFPDSFRYDCGVSALFDKVHSVLIPVGANRNKLRGASNHKETPMLANITSQAKNDIKELRNKLTYRVPKAHSWNKPSNYKDENKDVPEPNEEGISYEIELTTNSLVPPAASSELWTGKARYRRDGKPIWVRFKVTLNLIWYMKVFKKGLSVIEGHLVLEHTKTFPNGLLLLKAVRQGYGFTVNTVPAIYDPNRNKLSWVNDNAKLEAIEEGNKVPRRRRTKSELQGDVFEELK